MDTSVIERLLQSDQPCVRFKALVNVSGYDILFALKVMAEAGFIGDERCSDALDLLETKRLPDGGFPAEFRYYRPTDKRLSCGSLVGWGPTGTSKMNEFVTVDALGVLKAAAR